MTGRRKRGGAAFAALVVAFAGACAPSGEPAPDEPTEPTPGAPAPAPAEPAPADARPGERLVEVQVWFTRDEQPVAVTREVAAEAPLRGALAALLAGPTEGERERGLASWFSAETEGMLRGVTLDDAGRATVDFGDLAAVIPNASTSAGSAMLLSDLHHTVFQFPGVAEVEYRMEGSCDAFWNWLQRGCDVVRRGEAGVPGTGV